MKRKVCVVVTARPSYSRIRTALKAIQNHKDLELQLVLGASALLDRYGGILDYVRNDGFAVAAQVYMVLEGENNTSMAKTAGIGLLELATVFDNLRPDIVVTVADRHETIATAIAASYMNIPVAHVQGGEVTGSIDEKVRHAVTKLADVHFVASQKAAERVIKMGENPATVYVTGCPSVDIAAEVFNKPELDFNPIEKYGGVGHEIDFSNGYITVMQHPVTTEYEQSRHNIVETLLAVSAIDYPVFWFWPNVDAGSDGTSSGIRAFREIHDPKNIRFFKGMEPNDFLKLIYNSKCLIGNSSVGVRESAFLGIPVVNIGSRQRGRERGHNVIDVDYNHEAIEAAILHHLNNGRPERSTIYGDGAAGKQIADLLARIELTIEKRLTY